MKRKRKSGPTQQKKKIIEQFNEDNYDFEDGIPSAFCPCCQLKSPTNNQIIEYVCKRDGLTKKQLEEELRTKYKNYDEMLKDK